jgi:hypothetical protein
VRYRVSYCDVPDPISAYRLARAAVSEDAIVRAGRPVRETFERLDHDPNGQWANSRIDSRWQTAIRTFESARYRAPALEPMVRAFPAGLLCFWVVESKSWRQRHCVCVPRPRLHVADGRLHSDDEPAVSWTNGVSYWFWEGISVPRRALQQDGRVRFSSLVWTPNAERRRVLLERLGYERFLEAAGAKLVAQDDYGKLWRTELELDGEPVVAVEVVNATAEPDGTRRRYFLRVPPDTRSAREAVAWTFGFERGPEYQIAIES